LQNIYFYWAKKTTNFSIDRLLQLVNTKLKACHLILYAVLGLSILMTQHPGARSFLGLHFQPVCFGNILLAFGACIGRLSRTGMRTIATAAASSAEFRFMRSLFISLMRYTLRTAQYCQAGGANDPFAIITANITLNLRR
jgi:hypothetical protein